jgi:hypothetical protein
MYVETIQANNVKHVVAKAEACTQPTFDHRTVAIHVNIVLGWRLLRAPFERAGGMQHRWGRDRDRCSNLHRFLNEVPGLHDRFEPRGEQLRGRCQWAGASSSGPVTNAA